MSEYRNQFRTIEAEARWTAPRILAWGISIVVVLGVVGFLINLLFVPAAVITKVADPNAIISNYEEFQNLYNACTKINADIATIQAVPSDDAMFSQFSKAAMLTQKRQLLNRWVEEYNAKSKMITRSLWKSTTLPYQLSVADFSNYGGVK